MTPTEPENFWSAFAADFDKQTAYIVGQDELAHINQQVAGLTNLGNVLELGCGTAYYTPLLAANAKTVLSSDFSAQMVHMATQKMANFANVTVEQVNALALPYTNQQFDSIFMANLLHVLPEPEQVIAQCYPVLKPNGKLIALDFTTDGMRFLSRIGMTYRYLKTWGKPPKHARRLGLTDLQHVLPTNQFDITSAKLLGNRVKAAWVIARKK